MSTSTFMGTCGFIHGKTCTNRSPVCRYPALKFPMYESRCQFWNCQITHSTRVQLGTHLGASLSRHLKICCLLSSILPLLFLTLFVTPSSMPPCTSVLPAPPSQVTTPSSVLPPQFGQEDNGNNDEALDLLEAHNDFEAVMDDFLDNYRLIGKCMQPVLLRDTATKKLNTIHCALGGMHINSGTDRDDADKHNIPVPCDIDEKQDCWDCETILSEPPCM